MTFERIFEWLKNNECDFQPIGNDARFTGLKIVAPNGQYWIISPPYSLDVECPDNDLMEMILRFGIGTP